MSITYAKLVENLFKTCGFSDIGRRTSKKVTFVTLIYMFLLTKDVFYDTIWLQDNKTINIYALCAFLPALCPRVLSFFGIFSKKHQKHDKSIAKRARMRCFCAHLEVFMAIVAFANQKGGVGKTTSAVNVAACIGKKGKSVLLVDMDPQGNATSGVGISKKNIKSSIYEVLIGETPIKDALIQTKFKNLSVIPSTIALAGAEIDLNETEGKGKGLSNLLAELKDEYDYIIIDCPPTLGLLTINALSASNGVVIPMQCEFFSLEGLSQLIMTIKRVRQSYNPTLEISGILLTMYNGRLVLTNQVIEELKKYYSDKLFKTPITRSVKLSEAPGFGEPICYYDPYSKGSLEYMDVAKELMLRI